MTRMRNPFVDGLCVRVSSVQATFLSGPWPAKRLPNATQTQMQGRSRRCYQRWRWRRRRHRRKRKRLQHNCSSVTTTSLPLAYRCKRPSWTDSFLPLELVGGRTFLWAKLSHAHKKKLKREQEFGVFCRLPGVFVREELASWLEQFPGAQNRGILSFFGCGGVKFEQAEVQRDIAFYCEREGTWRG